MKHTVLVVDDEASIADGLRLTLEAEGYSRAHRRLGADRAGAVAQAEAHVAPSSTSCCPMATGSRSPVSSSRVIPPWR